MTKSVRVRVPLLVLAAALIVTPTVLAESVNAFITGQVQGPFGGDVTAKGLTGSVEVIAVNHSIVSPRDAASGLPTGKRIHKPFVIFKYPDKSSPRLLAAIATNEALTVEVRFYRTVSTGATVLYHTFKLTNANVAEITTDGTTASGARIMEKVSFTYQKIEVTDHVNGVVVVDEVDGGL